MRGKMLPDDQRHGTANGYSNLGCRCGECRAAKATDQRAQNAARARRGLPESDLRHGKASTYMNWRCRCQACTKAAAEYRTMSKVWLVSSGKDTDYLVHCATPSKAAARDIVRTLNEADE